MPSKRKKGGKGKPDAVTLEMARRLRQCRKARNWTQADVAKAIGWRQEDADQGKAVGISPSGIGNYEQGTRRFSNEEAEMFGRAFDLPSAYFLVAVDEHEAEVILAMRRRDPTPPRQPSIARRSSRS